MRAAFDLESRLIAFAVEVCNLCGRLPGSHAGQQAAKQLTRSATSPFANYGEARAAESRRDFLHKMRIVLKELRETRGWLRFVQQSGLAHAESMEVNLKECDELIAIFVTSIRTAERNGREGSGQ